MKLFASLLLRGNYGNMDFGRAFHELSVEC